MKPVYIVGVGMTPFRRHDDGTVKRLTAWAVEDALKDAGCDRRHIQAAYFGNVGQGPLEGQVCVPGQVALLPLGIQGAPIVNVENACATASTAFHLALRHLLVGDADIALAVGVEKLSVRDKAKAFALFEGGWDIETPEANAQTLLQIGAGIAPPPGTMSTRPYSRFMDIYAAFCRYHMAHYGLTQSQLAAVSAKNHAHAVHNERAQYRQAMSVQEVLASPPIAYPLTQAMCSPISDGAAAAILCTESALARYGFDRRRAIRVRASVLRSATARAWEDLGNHATRLAALHAYEQAGLGPRDMQVAEVHDATSMGEILQSENLGFCDAGEGGLLAESGATSIGGRIPINPSGGLESKGHPVGATGLGQIFELVQQLRGECGARQVQGARIAIQENGGGIWRNEEAACHVGIFSRD
ncbi:thiolase family protein [Cupriavidus sp. NPDC089707]|uniref:thiolase family protein n=1 Tax=Cupriavidus sp. NPDC089707 TaxID=3363963 RepID=UPI00382E0D4F